jgi:hypothetical protein
MSLGHRVPKREARAWSENFSAVRVVDVFRLSHVITTVHFKQSAESSVCCVAS